MVRSRLLLLGRHPWWSGLLVAEVVAFIVLASWAWSAWRAMPPPPPVLPEYEITVFPRLDTVDNVPLPSADVLELVRSVPGVRHAAVANQSPYSFAVSWAARAWKDDARDDDVVVAIYFGSDAMVPTLGLQLIEGRDFAPADLSAYSGDQTRLHARGAPAIISASLAERLFPGGSVIGGQLHIHHDAPLTVIGVAAALPAAANGLRNNPESFAILLPTAPADARLGPLLVRSGTSNRVRVSMAVEDVLKAAYPRALSGTPRPLSADRASMTSLRPVLPRALSACAGLSALVLLATLLLATEWMARHQRLELSLRLAFGASRRQLVREWGLELGALAGLGAMLGGLIAGSPIALRLSGGLPILSPLETTLLAAGCTVALFLMATWLAMRAFRIPPHLVSRSPSVRL
nr:ABC transporter permease [uncultured Pseudoxanthomonas sp.]